MKKSDGGRRPDDDVRRGDGQGMAATLKDVARLAGVSPITVSRTFNHPDLVTPQTRAAVETAVERLGYVPNRVAGSLNSNRSRLVAAIVPTIATPMFAEIVEALSDRLRPAGYEVLLAIAGFDGTGAREEELVATILGRRPDAVFLTGVTHTRRTRQRLLGAGIPVVEGWDLSPTPLDMSIGFSHEAVGRAAARHLLERGRRRLGVIAAADGRARKRAAGFRMELADRGVETVESREVDAPGTPFGGRSVLADWLSRDRGIDGVFCSSDAIAHGVHTEAHARRLAIPSRLAIVGFGDFAFARSLEPPLTTVSIDRHRLGTIAAEAILAEIDGSRAVERTIDIGYALIARGTS